MASLRLCVKISRSGFSDRDRRWGRAHPPMFSGATRRPRLRVRDDGGGNPWRPAGPIALWIDGPKTGPSIHNVIGQSASPNAPPFSRLPKSPPKNSTQNSIRRSSVAGPLSLRPACNYSIHATGILMSSIYREKIGLTNPRAHGSARLPVRARNRSSRSFGRGNPDRLRARAPNKKHPPMVTFVTRGA